MANNEDYLDSLLNSMMADEDNGNGLFETGDSFLDSFGQEKKAEPSETFLSAYEIPKEEPISSPTEFDFGGIDDSVELDEFDRLFANVEKSGNDGIFAVDMDDDFFKMLDGDSDTFTSTTDDNSTTKQSDVDYSEEDGSGTIPNALAEEVASDDGYVSEVDYATATGSETEPAGTEENIPETETDPAQEAPKEKASLADMFEETFGSDASVEEDLSDIDAMLKAEENGELIEGAGEAESLGEEASNDSGAPTEDVDGTETGTNEADELKAVDMDQLDAGELDGIKEIPEGSSIAEVDAEAAADATGEDAEAAKGKKGKKKKKEKGEKGPGFFQKIIAFLMSDGDEDEVVALQDPNATENLGAETDQVLADMQAEDGKKKKEKKKKEKKKKDEAAEGEEGKGGKKKEKKKKEKKPKPPKEPAPPSKPLPKLPVFLILVLFASLVALIMIGLNLFSYRNSISYAKSYFHVGSYNEAYESLAGVELKEEDKTLYEQARMCAVLENFYHGYETYLELGMEAEALDQLIRVCGTYYENERYYDEYEIRTQADALLDQATAVLKQKYGLTYDEAIDLYKLRRRDYSIAIYRLIE